MEAHESPRSRVRRDNYAARRSETMGRYRVKLQPMMESVLECLKAKREHDGNNYDAGGVPVWRGAVSGDGKTDAFNHLPLCELPAGYRRPIRCVVDVFSGSSCATAGRIQSIPVLNRGHMVVLRPVRFHAHLSEQETTE